MRDSDMKGQSRLSSDFCFARYLSIQSSTEYFQLFVSMSDWCNFLNLFDRESKQTIADWMKSEWQFDWNESSMYYYSNSTKMYQYYSDDDWNTMMHYELVQVEQSVVEEDVVDDDDDDDDEMVVDNCRELVELLLEQN